MGLMLDAFTTRLRRQINHIFCHLDITTMIDTNLSDHQRLFLGANFAVCNSHLRVLFLIFSWAGM